MAQFITDFSEYETNSPPHDWRDAWVPGDQQVTVISTDDATGGKVLRHEIESHDRRAWAWDKVPGTTEVDVRARLRTDHPRSRFGILARGAYVDHRDSIEGITWELFNGEDRDESEFEERRQEFRQIAWLATYDPTMEYQKGPKRPHGIGSVRGEGHFSWEPGSWYWLRLQARNVDGFVAVRAKVWAGDKEPDGWTYDVQRTERSDLADGGWVGITGQRTEGRREYDIFAIGTDGDEAPTQLTTSTGGEELT